MSILTNFLDKNVSLFHLGKRWVGGLCADIAEAARTGSYLETVGNKADTLHKSVAVLDERTLKRSYEVQVRRILKELKIKNVELAIDGTKDLYYGKLAGLNVRGIKHDRGADQAWEYIVLSIVKPIHIPLMAVHYFQGADLTKCCIELLEFAKTLNLNIKITYFDRGFYIAQLIDYLESRKSRRPIPYLILVPKDKKIKKYIDQTKNSIGVFNHQFKYSKDKSNWKPQTTIVVCKNAGINKKGEFYHMIFATNTKPSRLLIKKYKTRWNIETMFRVMGEGKIMSKSNNYLIRFFYFLLRCLLPLIWVLSKKKAIHLVFKEYLQIIEYSLRGFSHKKPPPMMPIW